MDRRNRQPGKCNRFAVRCFSDIRQTPLLVGMLQCLWALIPIADIDGSLFARHLDWLGIGREWGWLMLLSGAYLAVGSVYKRRETLTIALFLSACVWFSLTITFIDAALRWTNDQWITPVTLSMPAICLTLILCLIREMVYQPVVIPERRRVQRG